MRRVPLTGKVAYGIGDIGSQLTWSVAGSFLVLYYTDVVGIAAGVAAVLMFLTRLADLVIDPTVGSIIERTNSRWGRFRPWLLWTPPVLVVAMVLAFGAPAMGPDPTSRVLLAGLTYVLLGAVFAFVNLPYSALPAVMTAHPGDRVALNAWRMIGTNLGGLALGGLGMPLILLFGGGVLASRGFVLTALVLSTAAIPVFWVVFVGSREVVPVAQARKVSFGEMVRAITGNRQLLLVFVSSFLLLAGITGRMSVVVFFYLHTLGRPDLVAPLMMTQAVSGAVGILVLTRWASRFDKRTAVSMSYMAMAGAQIGLFLTPPEQVGVVFALTAALGMAAFGAPISLSMTADAVDWHEDRTGRRNDGVAFSTMSMGPKLASALGGALALTVIGALGYQAGAGAQPPQALVGISIAANLVPALLQLVALLPLRWYTITNEAYAELRGRLDARHAAAAHPATPIS